MENISDINILKNYIILYVEDDILNSKAVLGTLENIFKKVYVAYDGFEGIELYKKYLPDLILTDINMPNMSGLEMANKIIQINPDSLISIITAHDDKTYLKQSIDIGIVKYILKPLDMYEVTKSLIVMAKKLAIKDYEKTKNTTDKLFAMDEMIKSITHQWRQPLSVISTSASGIKLEKEMGTLNEDDELKYLDTIIFETQALSKVLDNFRDIKDISYGIKMEEFNLKDCIENAIFLSKKLFEVTNIKFVIDAKDVIIKRNEKLVTQILLEIFDNVKNTCISKKCDNCYFFIIINEDENKVMVSCYDSMGGIDERILDRIFEPYFTTKHQKFGTGLSLYMVKKLVEDIFQDEIKIYNKTFIYNEKEYTGACVDITINKD